MVPIPELPDTGYTSNPGNPGNHGNLSIATSSTPSTPFALPDGCAAPPTSPAPSDPTEAYMPPIEPIPFDAGSFTPPSFAPPSFTQFKCSSCTRLVTSASVKLCDVCIRKKTADKMNRGLSAHRQRMAKIVRRKPGQCVMCPTFENMRPGCDICAGCRTKQAAYRAAKVCITCGNDEGRKRHLPKGYSCRPCKAAYKTFGRHYRVKTVKTATKSKREAMHRITGCYTITCWSCDAVIADANPKTLAAHFEAEHATPGTNNNSACTFEGCTSVQLLSLTQLGNHTRLKHTHEKAFWCTVCGIGGVSTDTRGQLNAHLRKCHSKLIGN